jgi:hypothetical protein
MLLPESEQLDRLTARPDEGSDIGGSVHDDKNSIDNSSHHEITKLPARSGRKLKTQTQLGAMENSSE